MTFVTGEMAKGLADAERFAGTGGRVATLPDVIAARLAVEPSLDRRETAWDSYITTTSVEYAGVTKGGTQVLIVAHGVGPLASREGALAAYKRAPSRGDHANGGVRIPRAEFLKLESGAYGAVSVVSLDEIRQRYEYPFMTPLSLETARAEPLVAARFGPRWEEYLVKHDGFARCQWAASKNIDPKAYAGCIVDLGQPSECWYAIGATGSYPAKGLEAYPAIGGPEPTEAFGHLLVAGQLMSTHYPSHRQPMLVTDIGVHDPSDHCRFLGLRKDADLACIVPDVNASTLLRQHWRDLLLPVAEANRGAREPPIRCLRPVDKDTFFTTTVKDGHEMDSGIYEHPVRKATRLLDGEFVTKIHGYHGFVRYDLREVAAIAPPGANAYVLGDTAFTDGDATHHRISVTFYAAEIDRERRLMTRDELENDFDLFTRLATAELS